jgi:RNA 3'-terminal phosphate cyclase
MRRGILARMAPRPEPVPAEPPANTPAVFAAQAAFGASCATWSSRRAGLERMAEALTGVRESADVLGRTLAEELLEGTPAAQSVDVLVAVLLGELADLVEAHALVRASK